MKMKKLIMLPIIFMLAIMLGCSGTENEPSGANEYENGNDYASEEAAGEVRIDLSGGAETFMGYEPEHINLSVMRQGETLNFDFAGVSLGKVLESRGITEFTKIELVVADMDTNMDITDWAREDAGVFLAWSESGEPELPFRVFPRDAATGNLLIRYVTEIIITR